MNAKVKSLAQNLRNAAGDDIYYDAENFGDNESTKKIDDYTKGMMESADMIERMASVVHELGAALGGCIEQIGQMKGMVGDEDGAIQRALDDAEHALGQIDSLNITQLGADAKNESALVIIESAEGGSYHQYCLAPEGLSQKEAAANVNKVITAVKDDDEWQFSQIHRELVNKGFKFPNCVTADELI